MDSIRRGCPNRIVRVATNLGETGRPVIGFLCGFWGPHQVTELELVYAAGFTVYTYFAVVFERAIGGNSVVLGGLLVTWGVAGMISNPPVGRMAPIPLRRGS
jgi:hypothetical protein